MKEFIFEILKLNKRGVDVSFVGDPIRGFTRIELRKYVDRRIFKADQIFDSGIFTKSRVGEETILLYLLKLAEVELERGLNA